MKNNSIKLCVTLIDSCATPSGGHISLLSYNDIEMILTGSSLPQTLPDNNAWEDTLGDICHGWSHIIYPVTVEALFTSYTYSASEHLLATDDNTLYEALNNIYIHAEDM